MIGKFGIFLQTFSLLCRNLITIMTKLIGDNKIAKEEMLWIFVLLVENIGLFTVFVQFVEV